MFNWFKKKKPTFCYENVARLSHYLSPEDEVHLRITRIKDLYYVHAYDWFQWSDGSWYNEYLTLVEDQLMIDILKQHNCELKISKLNPLIGGVLLLDEFKQN